MIENTTLESKENIEKELKTTFLTKIEGFYPDLQEFSLETLKTIQKVPNKALPAITDHKLDNETKELIQDTLSNNQYKQSNKIEKS